MQSKKIFVTGGTGFIGSHFINLCLKSGYEVIATRRNGSEPRIPIDPSPKWINKNLYELKIEDFSAAKTLVHFAAVGVIHGSSDWKNCFKVNVEDSLHAWITAIEAGVDKLVICGSCFEYGISGLEKDKICTKTIPLPSGPYHASKAAATMAAIGICIDKKVKVSILRPFHVYGEGEAPGRFWPSLKEAAFSGLDFPMTAGDQIRDFIYVKDAAKAFINEVESDDIMAGIPVIKNIASGKEQTLKEFAKEWWRKWNAKGKIMFGQIPYRKNEVMRYIPEI